MECGDAVGCMHKFARRKPDFFNEIQSWIVSKSTALQEPCKNGEKSVSDCALTARIFAGAQPGVAVPRKVEYKVGAERAVQDFASPSF